MIKHYKSGDVTYALDMGRPRWVVLIASAAIISFLVAISYLSWAALASSRTSTTIAKPTAAQGNALSSLPPDNVRTEEAPTALSHQEAQPSQLDGELSTSDCNESKSTRLRSWLNDYVDGQTAIGHQQVDGTDMIIFETNAEKEETPCHVTIQTMIEAVDSAGNNKVLTRTCTIDFSITKPYQVLLAAKATSKVLDGGSLLVRRPVWDLVIDPDATCTVPDMGPAPRTISYSDHQRATASSRILRSILASPPY